MTVFIRMLNSLAMVFLLTGLLWAESNPGEPSAKEAETTHAPSLEAMRQTGMERDPRHYAPAPGEKPEALEKRDLRQPHWAEGLVVRSLQGLAQQQERENPDRDTRPVPEPPQPLAQ